MYRYQEVDIEGMETSPTPMLAPELPIESPFAPLLASGMGGGTPFLGGESDG